MVDVEPGLRVHHVPAGPLDAGAQGGAARRGRRVHRRGARAHEPPAAFGTDEDLPFDLSPRQLLAVGASPGTSIKHELDLPLVCTFHTLDRVKAESMPEEVEADMPHRRAEAEAAIIDCSDAVLASCTVEAEQIADALRRRPGPHPHRGPRASTTPSSAPATAARPAAPSACPPTGRLLLFVGRIQPLKCADVAVETLAELSAADGDDVPPGRRGRSERPARARRSCRAWSHWPTTCGVARPRAFVAPQPHELLSTYYRAADVCLVPSRSESFGLVALEAAACGTPVVASAVGGLTHAGRPRAHRLPGRRPRPGRLRRLRAAGLRRAAGGRAALHASVLRARRYTWAGRPPAA